MLQTVSLHVQGKVQGVFYRQSTREKALSLGIGGTVRNNADGSVVIVATGTADQLDALLQWSKKGPAAARVTAVTVREESLQSFNDFRVVR
jgi:acylphosphatase